MLHIITGPPAAGKTTYVETHARRGDLRIDFDQLANLFAGLDPGNHNHTEPVLAVTRAARAAAINSAIKQSSKVDVWLIHSDPPPASLAKYRAAGAKFHTIDPGRAEVLARIKQTRSREAAEFAETWYQNQTRPAAAAPAAAPGGPRTTTERGLGWDHQQTRTRLLRSHRNGTPCWWCALPMFIDRTGNWDGDSLHADHSRARANGGAKADRLLHGRCNKQRQTGRWDDERPALTGVHPADWKSPTGQTGPALGPQPVAVAWI